MGNFGFSSFGSAFFGGDPTPQLLFQVDAELTRLAEHLIARGSTDGTCLRALEFSVGRGGFDPFDYASATPVNPNSQVLDDEIFRDEINQWEKPNERAVSFHCVLEQSEANETLGEIGIWAEIHNSPNVVENGTFILFAIGHFPMKAKADTMRYGLRVVVQL